MKKIITILCLLLISCNFNKEKVLKVEKNNLIKVSGTIENLKDSLRVVIAKIDAQNFYGKKIDSTLTLKGSFEFKINVNEASEYLIMIIDIKNNTAKRTNLWLNNNDILIQGTFDNFENAKINGSKLTELSKKYNGIIKKYNNQMKNGEIDLKTYRKRTNEESLNFLFKNPNNLVSLTEILNNSRSLNKDSLKLFYSKLDSKLQNSKKGIALKNSFEIEKVKVGKPFFDIVAKNLEGNIVKISDFKGKVIVLDFWAYWCHYCHEQNQEEFPKLKEKYKNEDFVIISYSVDLDKKDWERSSKEDNVDWINISNLQGVNDKYVSHYGVEAYPTSFLIGKDGLIVKKFEGYVYDALENELDKIFEINNK